MTQKPHDIIEYIMRESTVIHDLSEAEQQQVREALTLDLNQHIMNVLLTIMESDDLDVIEELIDANDQTGIIELINTLSKKPEIADLLAQKLEEYLESTITDFKKIKKLLQSQKNKENRKNSGS